MKTIRLFILLTALLMFFSCLDSKNPRFLPEKYFTGSLLPIAHAIYEDDAKAVKRFIKEDGISVDALDEYREYSLLIYAINTESKSVVKTLLELGADPNMVAHTKVYKSKKSDEHHIHDRWPLSNATYKSDLFYMKILFKYGADAKVGNPLHVALLNAPEKSTISIFELLLDHGADINSQNEAKETPLFTSLYIHRADLANFFLDHGADITIADYKGRTPAILLQERIDRYAKDRKYDKVKTQEYIDRLQPTIDRFEAKGETFTFPQKPVEE